MLPISNTPKFPQLSPLSCADCCTFGPLIKRAVLNHCTYYVFAHFGSCFLQSRSWNFLKVFLSLKYDIFRTFHSDLNDLIFSRRASLTDAYNHLIFNWGSFLCIVNWRSQACFTQGPACMAESRDTLASMSQLPRNPLTNAVAKSSVYSRFLSDWRWEGLLAT